MAIKLTQRVTIHYVHVNVINALTTKGCVLKAPEGANSAPRPMYVGAEVACSVGSGMLIVHAVNNLQIGNTRSLQATFHQMVPRNNVRERQPLHLSGTVCQPA